MFRGSSFHSIDAKGRIIIPVRFRSLIAEDDRNGVVVSRMDDGLFAYTFDEWGRIENNILSLPEKDNSMRRFIRIFIGSATECICDKQDRILLPQILRDYAKLEKEIVLVGALNHFEIRSRENWEVENAEMENDLKNEGLRDTIAKLGL